MDIISILIYIAVFLFGVYCGYGARPTIETGVALMRMQKEENKRIEAEEKQTNVNSTELPNSKVSTCSKTTAQPSSPSLKETSAQN